jgi:hypothetical protein
MAEIVLAECSGQAWLVRGEQHIDDLLANTLDPDVSIEVLACESKLAVDDLWRQWNDADPALMWLIHPAIVNRARGKPGELAVTFTPWSAAIDDGAQRAIRSAADAVNAKAGATLALVLSLASEGVPLAAQMAELRCGLLEAQLSALGVARMTRITRVADTHEEMDRIVLVVQP